MTAVQTPGVVAEQTRTAEGTDRLHSVLRSRGRLPERFDRSADAAGAEA